MSLFSAFPVELKFISEQGVFEGYASVFNVTDSVNDKIVPGAFNESLAAAKAEGRLPPLLWQHDVRQPIGAWRDIYEDSHGLYVKGELFVSDIPRAREVYKLLRENVISGLSIGYKVRQSYRDEKSGTRMLSDIDLLEISVVTFPANDQARILRVKSSLSAGHIPPPREFEAFLRDAGLSRKQAKGFLALGYKSLLPRCDLKDADEQDMPDTQALQSLADKIRSLI